MIFSEYEQAKCFHDLGKIDPPWAKHGAIVTRSADPIHVEPLDLRNQAYLGHADYLTGQDVHMVSHRANSGAISALNAKKNVLSAYSPKYLSDIFFFHWSPS